MATKVGRIDFMFLAPPPPTRPLDPLLYSLVTITRPVTDDRVNGSTADSSPFRIEIECWSKELVFVGWLCCVLCFRVCGQLYELHGAGQVHLGTVRYGLPLQILRPDVRRYVPHDSYYLHTGEEGNPKKSHLDSRLTCLQVGYFKAY